MMAYDQAKDSAFVVPYDYKGLYVAELESIIDMDAIRDAKLRILVNALGGSGMNLLAPDFRCVSSRPGLRQRYV